MYYILNIKVCRKASGKIWRLYLQDFENIPYTSRKQYCTPSPPKIFMLLKS